MESNNKSQWYFISTDLFQIMHKHAKNDLLSRAGNLNVIIEIADPAHSGLSLSLKINVLLQDLKTLKHWFL